MRKRAKRENPIEQSTVRKGSPIDGAGSITGPHLRVVCLQDKTHRNSELKFFSTNSACLYTQYINYYNFIPTRKNKTHCHQKCSLTSKYPQNTFAARAPHLPDPIDGLGGGRGREVRGGVGRGGEGKWEEGRRRERRGGERRGLEGRKVWLRHCLCGGQLTLLESR